MACPNKKEDEKIIAEYNRRKALKTAPEIQPTYQLTYVWEGSLLNIQLMGIEESKIASIRRLRENTWEILLNNIP